MMLPVGTLRKAGDFAGMAAVWLTGGDKKDSQEICFVTRGAIRRVCASAA